MRLSGRDSGARGAGWKAADFRWSRSTTPLTFPHSVYTLPSDIPAKAGVHLDVARS
jgi:hypothetical protein